MASDQPAAYMDYSDAFAWMSLRSSQDLSWAKENTEPVEEGPWAGVSRVLKIYYIGIDAAGNRIRLPQLSSFWRYKPHQVLLANAGGEASSHDTFYVVAPSVIRIELGRSMPGILAERPKGERPTQSTGLIDGEDFYFREEVGIWSLSVGGADPLENPEWHHEEARDDQNELSEEEAYDLIAKGAALMRSGTPTMALDSQPDHMEREQQP